MLTRVSRSGSWQPAWDEPQPLDLGFMQPATQHVDRYFEKATTFETTWRLRMAKLCGNAATCPHCRLLIAKQILERGRAVKAVAVDFETTMPTVRKWVRRYVELGVEGLVDRSSRPHRISRQFLKPGPALEAAVFALLHAPPRDSGCKRTAWRLRDLKATLAARGMTASANSVRAVIRGRDSRGKRRESS
jgi:transposase